MFDHQKQFYHSVCHALSTASTMLAYSNHRKLLEEMLAEFQKIETPSGQYNRVQEYIRMPVFKDKLPALRLYLVNFVLDFGKNEKRKTVT